MTQKRDLDTITLTDNTLENIKLMAPLLSKEDQCKVYGMLFGLLSKSPGKGSGEKKTA